MKTSIIVIALLLSASVYAQVTVTAVPFLLIEPSPEANGMAGISSTILTDDPFAMVSNPAQLGFQSFDRLASFATYAQKTLWLPKFNLPDLTYDVKAGLLGIDSDQFISLPFNISLGVGYSRIYLNLGTITQTGPGGPEPTGTFHAYETSDAISTAIGFEYLVKFGFGFNFKKIHSVLSPVGTEQEAGQGEAKVSAHDVGFMVNVPIFEVLSHFSKENDFEIYPGIASTLDLTLGYSRNNIGGEVTYIDAAQADPLPRYAALGLAAELSFVSKEEPTDWKLFSLTFARQTEDVLVKRDQFGMFMYQNGLGDIEPFNNLLLGKQNSSIEQRTGVRLSLCEMFSLRIGWYEGTGKRIYQTSGLGFRLSGLLKLLQFFDLGFMSTPLGDFLHKHIDLAVNTSQYYNHGDQGPLEGTKFFGLAIMLR